MLPPAAFVYAGVFVAAAVEGEIVFVTASLSVALGRLDFWAVLVAGALGGSIGDQFYFYAFRGPFSRFLHRFPRLAARRDAVGRLADRYALPLTAVCRFLPGLRIAIPAACAATSMPSLMFSVVSLLSAFAWAAAILWLVAGAGPAALDRLGVARNYALGVSALVVLLLFVALGRIRLGPGRARP